MLSIEIKKKYYNYIIFFYFSFIFFFCWSIIDDYGVALDDYIYYKNGENTYLYIKNLFLSLFDNQIEPSKFKNNINVFPTVYELFLVFTCKVLNITDFKDIYLGIFRPVSLPISALHIWEKIIIEINAIMICMLIFL